MAAMAMRVLPLPVAIWMSARGRSWASDFSRLVMAVIWADRRSVVMRRGICCRRFLSVEYVRYGSRFRAATHL